MGQLAWPLVPRAPWVPPPSLERPSSQPLVVVASLVLSPFVVYQRSRCTSLSQTGLPSRRG